VSAHRKGRKWVVRYREGGRNRSRSFDRKTDAERFDAEVKRRRQLGTLASLEAGRETLDEFVVDTWAPTHAVTLAPKTRKHYASLYDHHVSPHLGAIPLRELRADHVARWQAERLAGGAGPVAVRQALELLGAILQRAVEAERITANPTRLVRKARRPRREEVRPLAPIGCRGGRWILSCRCCRGVVLVADHPGTSYSDQGGAGERAHARLAPLPRRRRRRRGAY
jgi:integrase